MLTLRNDEFDKALAKYGALANSSQTFELVLAIDYVLSSDDIAKIFTHWRRRSRACSLRPQLGASVMRSLEGNTDRAGGSEPTGSAPAGSAPAASAPAG